jgi:hypothetical protein
MAVGALEIIIIISRRANSVVLVQRLASSRPRKRQHFNLNPKGKENCLSLNTVRQEEFPLIQEIVSLFVLFKLHLIS